MKRKRKSKSLTDEELAWAAGCVMDILLSQLPPEGEYEYEFSEEHHRFMEEIIAREQAHEIEPAVARMGWQYYTKRGLAAALIAALLAGITMPEAVMAGYRWLVEVVEKFFENRTEYHYNSNSTDEIEFIPFTLNYLPYNMTEKKHVEDVNDIKLLLVDDSEGAIYYLDILQRLVRKEVNVITHGANTEINYTEIVMLGEEIIKLVVEDDEISFVWVHDVYYISGQTNLPKEELIKILTNITFE